MLGLKNLVMLPSHFDYIFVHVRQKTRLRPELSPKFCQLQARIRPKPDPKSPARLTTLLRTLVAVVIKSNSILLLFQQTYTSKLMRRSSQFLVEINKP